MIFLDLISLWLYFSFSLWLLFLLIITPQQISILMVKNFLIILSLLILSKS